MPITIGSTGNSGCPVIRLTIAGLRLMTGTEFEATVDTGFNGFIPMPIMSALPLGLILHGATSVQFADGTTEPRFTAVGIAKMGEESEAGIVILEPSTTDVLVGMEFLRKFKKSTLIHRGVVVLVDESEIDEALQKSIAAYEAAQIKPPTQDSKITLPAPPIGKNSK